jgi:hypothetical protein
MLHIIQENLFKEVHYNILIDTLKRFDIPHQIVRIYPFVDWVVDINDVPDDFNNVEDLPQINPKGKVWCWGSLSMTRIANERGWNPGTMINDNHNYEVYSKWWKSDLLNYDSQIMTIGDDLPWERGELFLRPTEDNKAFTGKVFDKETWENTKKAYLNESGYRHFKSDTKIQVSTPKHIQKEIRLWVIKDEIVTGSYYRLGGAQYMNNNIEPEAIEFAKSVIKKGSIADAWVLDICMSNGEWKVVECGCINHAGFYASELNKTLQVIEEKFK